MQSEDNNVTWPKLAAVTRARQLAICLLALMVGIGGCSREARITRHLERAEHYFAANQYDRAELEYLNVLRLEVRENPRVLERLGAIYQEQGQVLKANAFLVKARDLEPENRAVRLRLARLYLQDQAWDRARSEVDFVLQQQPAHEEALVILADTARTPAAIAAALQQVEQVRSQAADRAGFHVARGKLLLREKDYRGAETAFRRALTLDSKSSAAHWGLGSLFLARTNQTRAEAELTRAVQSAPLRSVFRLQYADYQIRSGAVTAAKRQLEELVREVPDWLPAMNRLAEIALVQTNYPACDRWLQQVLARDSINFAALLLDARLDLARQSWGTAIARLEQLKKLYPGAGRVYTLLAAAHLLKQNMDGAINALQEGVTWNPNYTPAVLLLAKLQARRGDPASAVAGLSAYLEQHAEDQPAQSLLAHLYRAQGRAGQALAIYRRLMATSPSNPELPFWIGQILRQQHQNAEARVNFEQALKIAPGFLPAVDQLVELDVEEKQLAAAFQRVQAEVARRPNAAEVHFLLAKVYAARKDLPQTEAELLKTIELDPAATRAYVLLARIYSASHDYPKALDKMQERLARNPEDQLALLTTALLYERARNYPQARQTYEQLLAIHPGLSEVQNNLAYLYVEQFGELEKAYDLARKAHQSRPHEPSVADTLGWVQFKRGHYRAALGLLEESARQLPRDAVVHYHLGLANYMMAREEPARRALERALQLSKDFSGRAVAQNRLETLAIDPAALSAEAVTALAQRAQEQPGDPVVALRLGAVYQIQKAWDKARLTYEQTLARNPKAVPVMYALAQLHSGPLGNTAQAYALSRTAHDLDPDNPRVSHLLGRLAFHHGEYSWALNLLVVAGAKLSTDAEVLYDLGRSYYSMGRVPEALAQMKRALALNESFAHAAAARQFIATAELIAHPEQALAARERIEQLRQAQPEDHPALMAAGLIAWQQGDASNAKRLMEEGLKQYPFFTPADRLLAKIYFQEQKPGGAQVAYGHALKAYPAFPEDWELARILGLLTARRGDNRRAVQILGALAAKSPTDGEVQFAMGMAQYRLGRLSASRKYLKQALSTETNASWKSQARKVLAELK